MDSIIDQELKELKKSKIYKSLYIAKAYGITQEYVVFIYKNKNDKQKIAELLLIDSRISLKIFTQSYPDYLSNDDIKEQIIEEMVIEPSKVFFLPLEYLV